MGKTKSFFAEFKEFISKGNILDLAIGVIIGGAFGKIVSSLVGDILMPVIGLLFGGVNFTELKVLLKDAVPAADGVEEVAASYLNYGMFIQNIIDFLIIGFCMFLVVKGVMKLQAMSKKEEEVEEEPAPAEPTNEELMLETLSEIRDLMKKDN